MSSNIPTPNHPSFFQSMSTFDKQKQGSLQGVDLSRKGSIDAPILDLTKLINDHSDLFTLSSCSGRIVILREAECEETVVRKAGCDWLLVSHDSLDPDHALSTLADREDKPGCVVLKFEPMVLHIQCRGVDIARTLCHVATQSGFRNSGLTVGKHGKVVLAVRSTHGLEVPLTDDKGHDLVTSDYIRYIVSKANTKLDQNEKRIRKFESLLTTEELGRCTSVEKEISTEGISKKIYRRKNKRNRPAVIVTDSRPGSDDELCLDFIS